MAGCGADETDSIKAEPAVASATAPTGAAVGDQPIQKKVGERAGLGCSRRGADEPCSVNFTVTGLELINCARNSDLKANQKVVRISIDADVRAPLPGTSHPGLFLISDNWRSKTADGYVSKVKPVWCGEDVEHGPLNDVLQVGDTGRGSDNFAVPQDATVLILRDSGFAGWEWMLP
ncbi:MULTISPECIES: hypothetical protein [Gordonia]|uniref:hypothetical protein n=1 Tax=Gordonia TaxID=2053 RepID=UPI003265D93B